MALDLLDGSESADDDVGLDVGEASVWVGEEEMEALIPVHQSSRDRLKFIRT